jgi:hypothetical protein
MGRPAIRLTPEEEEQIVGLLRQGMSCQKVGRSVGRSSSTVAKVANQYGINTQQAAQQKAHESSEAYTRIRRAAMLDKILTRLDSLCDKLDKPGSAYNYAMAVAVIIDKRRQEEVTEQAGTKGAVIELVSRLVRQDVPAVSDPVDVDTDAAAVGKVSA